MENSLKITAFFGSPRENGNTHLLLKETIKGIEDSGFEVHQFNLNAMDIMPCQDCGGCNETGECIYNDDMDAIYEAIRDSDRIILASPIFFFGVSAQSKAMIDRCQSFYCEKYLLKKPLPQGENGRKGLLLLVGGMDKEIGPKSAGACAKAFFRTISVDEHDTFSFLGVDEEGAILKHPTALKEAYKAGIKLVGA
ncbi:iron-sulfur flavoprotein [bacterium BMS3Abin09]|nr:iron-sulfur flavoprotein [bacterium BMS3Abin09]GBE41692.1 iron-sulfur flavoprotein [bacterium BMS3Bbin09]